MASIGDRTRCGMMCGLLQGSSVPPIVSDNQNNLRPQRPSISGGCNIRKAHLGIWFLNLKGR